MNNQLLLGPNLHSGSKQAYFDKAKPITNAQEYKTMQRYNKNEIDQFLGEALLTNTARAQGASDVANRKVVGEYLEKMRERNSSLQERLNLSFKSSSRLDCSTIVQRPATSFQNLKWLNFMDRSKCKSLNRSSAITNRQTKTVNKLNLSIIKPCIQNAKGNIQLTQRNDSSLMNLRKMKTVQHVAQHGVIDEEKVDQDHFIERDMEEVGKKKLSKYFTARENHYEEENKSVDVQPEMV